MRADDERVGAFVDNELGPAEAEALARAAIDDPALARRIERQGRLRDHLAVAYDQRLVEPVPDRVLRLLERPAPRPVRALRAPWPSWTSLGLSAGGGFALAASIAAAIGMWNSAGSGYVAFSRTGTPLAAGALATALDRRLGGASDAVGHVQLVGSFKASDGRYCRLFNTHAQTDTVGLACKDAAGWAIAALAAGPRPETAPYRQAASSLPPAIVTALDQAGLSEPLSAEQERAARADGWRARR